MGHHHIDVRGGERVTEWMGSLKVVSVSVWDVFACVCMCDLVVVGWGGEVLACGVLEGGGGGWGGRVFMARVASVGSRFP